MKKIIFTLAISILITSCTISILEPTPTLAPTRPPLPTTVRSTLPPPTPTLIPPPAPTQVLPTLTPAVKPLPTLDGLRGRERSFLPFVNQQQKWNEIAIISKKENFAPSIVKLKEGGYRIFWNDAPLKGVTSATSRDGITFAPDAGLRLLNSKQGDLDCIASHPWVVAMNDGYRMYYQGNADCDPRPNSQPVYRVFSAFSKDGLNFTREGVRIDIGNATGLSAAAHGRILKLKDGSYRMYFSANFIGKEQPADVLGATSSDGLTWRLDARPILERAHDPTVIQIQEKIFIYTTFLGDNFVILESSDGYEFTPTTWLDFYGKSGKRIEEFGDADILQLPDGKLLIYGSGKGSQGVGIYEVGK